MSKRKNTLNDLEEFLKLQASTLVPPKPVEGVKPVEEIKSVETKKEEVENTAPAPPLPLVSVPVFDLLEEMKKLAQENKSDFYNHIIKAAESLPADSNDVLLINTALYLKHGDNWKSGIEEYWKKRKSTM